MISKEGKYNVTLEDIMIPACRACNTPVRIVKIYGEPSWECPNVLCSELKYPIKDKDA